MRTKEEIKLGQNIRLGLNEILKLWASVDEQIEYQINVPIADVSAELFCKWCDDYYNEGDPIMMKEFNKMELKLLKEFDEVICRVANITPEELPDINEFIKTNEWKRVHIKAISTIKKLQW